MKIKSYVLISAVAAITLVVPLQVASVGIEKTPLSHKMLHNPPPPERLKEIRAERETCLECHSDRFSKEFPNGESLSLHVNSEKLESSVHGTWLSCTDCHDGYEIDEDTGEHIHIEAGNRKEFMLAVEKSCRGCHSDMNASISRSAHSQKFHGPSCVECHGFHGIERIDGRPGSARADARCVECHRVEVVRLSNTVHSKAGIGCVKCHGGPHSIKDISKPQNKNVLCSTCHEKEAKELAAGAHNGEMRVMACVDCHGSHELRCVNCETENIDAMCLQCHGSTAEGYRSSAHAKAGIGCSECHGIHEIRSSRLVKDDFSRENCTKCHEKHNEEDFYLYRHIHATRSRECSKCHETEYQEYLESAHSKNRRGPDCTECHGSHTTEGVDLTPQEETRLCSDCHEYESREFAESAHGKAPDGPSCTSCHGTHYTDWVEKISPKEVSAFCGKCHEETVKDYENNVHQIAIEQGNTKAPTCITCHGAHTMQVVTDPREGWALRFFKVECRTCHEQFCDIANKHTWMYDPEFHLSSNLICADCHVPKEGVSGHILAKDVKPVMKCESCHDAKSLLAKPGQYDQSLMAFMNTNVTKEFGYLIGASRVPIVDKSGLFLIVAVIVIFPIGHGGLRILMAFRRKKEKKKWNATHRHMG